MGALASRPGAVHLCIPVPVSAGRKPCAWACTHAHRSLVSLVSLALARQGARVSTEHVSKEEEDVGHSILWKAEGHTAQAGPLRGAGVFGVSLIVWLPTGMSLVLFHWVGTRALPAGAVSRWRWAYCPVRANSHLEHLQIGWQGRYSDSGDGDSQKGE